jgi:hypothetical protein
MTIFARSFFPTPRYFQVVTAATVTGMPFSAPLPDGSSMNVGGDRMLVFTPGESFATVMRLPGFPSPHPCGIATGTGRPGISADTIMDVIAGGAWYAVCVRRIKNVDDAAEELTELVLRGVLV